jgi:hypothetical protein
LEQFRSGDQVAVLICSHELHQQCFDTAFAHIVNDNESRAPHQQLSLRCPVCRGPATLDRARTHDTPSGSGFATPTEHYVVIDMQTSLQTAGICEPVFLTRGDGRLYVVLDTGAVGNLCGDRWAQKVAAMAVRHRQRPTQQKLKKTLEVGGVGTGTQSAFWETTLPLAMPSGEGACIQSMTVPMVDSSDLPCLWGLTSLTDNRAVIDLTTNQLHLLGPGDCELRLPPGSTSIAMERDASSGHLLVPCDMYELAATTTTTTTAPRALLTEPTSSSTPGAASSSSRPSGPSPSAGARRAASHE